MGAFKNTVRSARNFIGRSWGHTKKFVHGAKDTIDAGISIYSKLQPVLNEGAQAFGNKQVKDFSRKAQDAIQTGVTHAQHYSREISSNVDKLDDLGAQFMNAFR